jgi:glycosyltransferase involved in cell wall biosynthesis
MKVSVIIPVYNVKPYLERCVQSVLGQTYKDIEMILVDDGSTDGSGQLCDELAVERSQIRVIHQENQGLSAARNTGISCATGEYVVFLDSDDEWLLKDGLEKILQENTTNNDLIVFKSVDIWKNCNYTYLKDYDIKIIRQLTNAQTVFEYLVLQDQFRISACFLLISRLLLIEHDIYFPIGYISEDLHWSLLLWQCANNVTFCNVNFYGYHHRGNSISTTASINVYKSYDTFFSFWKEQCNNNCINATSIRYVLANMWVSRGYGFYMLKSTEKQEALDIMQRHADLLNYPITLKVYMAAKLVRIIGIKSTIKILSAYWYFRTKFKSNNA